MLEALLDSWDRNNTILVNLLYALPDGMLDARVLAESQSIAEIYRHVHFTRLWLVSENAAEFGTNLPGDEAKTVEQDRGRMAERLNHSAKAVRDAVKSRVEAGQATSAHYDHPLLMIQHLIWHEGYHHGQIKLALKAAGHALDDEMVAGPITWDVWMDKLKTRGRP